MAKLIFAVALLLLASVAHGYVLVQSAFPAANGTECMGDTLSSVVTMSGMSCDHRNGTHFLSMCTDDGLMVAANCNHNCSQCDAPAALPDVCLSFQGMHYKSFCSAMAPEDIPGLYKVAMYAEDDCSGTPVKVTYTMVACHHNATGNSSMVAHCEDGEAQYYGCAGSVCEDLANLNPETCQPVQGPPSNVCHMTPREHSEGTHPDIYVQVSCVAHHHSSGNSTTTEESSTSGGSGSTSGGSGSATSGGSGSTGGATGSTGGSTTGGSTTADNVSGAAAVAASIALVAMAAVFAL